MRGASYRRLGGGRRRIGEDGSGAQQEYMAGERKGQGRVARRAREDDLPYYRGFPLPLKTQKD